MTLPPLPAAVLWDMDGTLVDTEPYWMRCEHALAAKYGGRWSEQDALAVVGGDLVDSATYMREHMGIDRTPSQIVEELLDGVVVSQRHDGRGAPVGGDADRELDRALLVRARREAGVAPVDALGVLGEDDLARRVDDALDADQWVGHLMRSLDGSRSGVASTEPTVTG